MKKIALTVAAVMLAAGVVVAKGDKKQAVKPASELEYKSVKDARGVTQAVLWGEPTKGEHGSITRFEANTNQPLHTHSSGMKGVVLKGQFIYTDENGAESRLGPGSYVSIPAGYKHKTASGADGFEIVGFWDGKFDVKPVDEKQSKVTPAGKR